MPDQLVSLSHCQQVIPWRYHAPKFQILNLNFTRTPGTHEVNFQRSKNCYGTTVAKVGVKC
jgi:hypothetical protein